MKTTTEILMGLDHFTGSETFTRHGLSKNVVMTDGVVWLAENAGAHWLTNIVVSHQINPKVATEEFQMWVLRQNADKTWLVWCDDGDGNIIVEQKVEFSDFPLPEIKLYLVKGSVDGVTDAWVLMLPGEY